MAPYPTKTRIALLRQIANVQVMTDVENDRIVLFPDAPTAWHDQMTVTARVREVERAGWAREDWHSLWWVLTEAGRDVLEAA